MQANWQCLALGLALVFPGTGPCAPTIGGHAFNKVETGLKNAGWRQLRRLRRSAKVGGTRLKC